MKKLFLMFGLLALQGVCKARTARGIIVVTTGWTGAGVGKVIDYLADKADVIALTMSVSNKGRRILKRSGDGFNLTQVPSGIVRKNTQCYVTGGVEIDPSIIFGEIDRLIDKGISINGRLWISSRAHVVMPYHRKLDALMANQYREGSDIGSRKGVGAAAADKRLRVGIRIADLLDPERFKKVLRQSLNFANKQLEKVFNEKPFNYDEILKIYTGYARRFKPFVKDDLELELNKLLVQGKAIIFEGSQGTFLDLTMGSYPYVSSSSTTAAAMCVGAGVGPGPSRIGHVLGVVQAYNTVVGPGPLPAEIKDQVVLKKLREAHKSYCEEIPGLRYGWIDLVLIRQAILINGIDSLVISKLDELDTLDEIKICYDYVIDGKNYDYLPPNIAMAKKIEPRYMTLPGWKKQTDKSIKNFSKLHQNAKAFVKKIEQLSCVPVSHVSIGPERHHMIEVNDLLPL